jgi:hypothetical protein
VDATDDGTDNGTDRRDAPPHSLGTLALTGQ